MKRLLVGIALLALTACSTQTATKTGTAPSAQTNAPSAAATPVPTLAPVQLFHVGDVVNVVNGADKLSLSVESINDKVSVRNPYLQPKGHYLLITVVIQNLGSTPANIASFINFELRDAAGQSYSQTALLGENLPNPPDGEIAVNDKLKGALIYDVPTSPDFRLYFKAISFSSGQAIFDLGAQ